MNRRELFKSAAAVGAIAVIGVSAKRFDIKRHTSLGLYDDIRYLRVSLQDGDRSFHHAITGLEEDWINLSDSKREQWWKSAEAVVIRAAEAAA